LRCFQSQARHSGLVHEQCAQLLAATVGTVLLAAVGAFDDMRSLRAAPRLAIQCVAVGAIIAALPADLQILPHLPRWLEHSCLFVGGLWFVNLVNFMDGIDWMTVAEFVLAAGAIVLLGMADEVDLPATALLGAIAGFAPFGRGSNWVMPEACPWAFCSAGSCCSLPQKAIWRRR
jgi:UDP-N-acetylmuramyl pentapeptide phosphotransferase/UDP-N-acetylglucosamine-1-phosphate transferase